MYWQNYLTKNANSQNQGDVNEAARHLMVGQVMMEKIWNSIGSALRLLPKQKCCHCLQVPKRQLAKKVIYHNPQEECKSLGGHVYGNVSK